MGMLCCWSRTCQRDKPKTFCYRGRVMPLFGSFMLVPRSRTPPRNDSLPCPPSTLPYRLAIFSTQWTGDGVRCQVGRKAWHPLLPDKNVKTAHWGGVGENPTRVFCTASQNCTKNVPTALMCTEHQLRWRLLSTDAEMGDTGVRGLFLLNGFEGMQCRHWTGEIAGFRYWK